MNNSELDDLIESDFIEWFETKLYEPYEYRYNHFYENTKIEDNDERELSMLKWVKSAFYEGYIRGSITFSGSN